MDRTNVTETVSKNRWLPGADLFQEVVNERNDIRNLVQMSESIYNTFYNSNSPDCQSSYITLQNADIVQNTTYNPQNSNIQMEEQNKGNINHRILDEIHSELNIFVWL